MEQKKVILIGAGNVAHHLAAAFMKQGIPICQIYSRSLESARELGMRTGISYTSDANQVFPDGDIYLFCVSDDALPVLPKNLRFKENPLLLHTSGSQPMTLFKSFSSRYGVLYPLQTFSKNRELDFEEIPLFIEGNTPAVAKEIEKLALLLSPKVYEIDSEQRRLLHLSAVFACNFSNYLYHMAGTLLESGELSFSMLRPLIEETAHKVMSMSPEEAQTGPAKRGDEMVMIRHRNLLKNRPEYLQLYSLMSEMIREEEAEEELPQEEKTIHPRVDMPTLW